MKKILAALLAMSLVLVFAACKGNGGGETTTSTEPETTDVNATLPSDGESSTQGNTVGTDSSGNTITDPSQTGTTPSSTVAPTTPEGKPVTTAATKPPVEPKTASEIIAYYNNATALANNSKPAMKRVATTKLIDDSIKGTDFISRAAIGALLNFKFGDSSVRKIIGDFLKEGTQTSTAKKGQNSLLVKSTVSTSDLQGTPSITTSGNNYVINFSLKGESNPQKNGKSALGRLTADYVTGAEALAEIKKADTGGISVNVDNISMTTSNVKVSATIDKTTGKIVSVTHSLSFDALISGIKVSSIKLNGAQGNGTMNTVYSNFVW